MKSIVVVDDNDLVCSIYRNKLSGAGYRVEIVAEGRGGLAVIEHEHPDLVLLDLNLPGLDGIQIISQLRANPEFTHMPIVVLSGVYNTARIEAATQAGATRVLSKASSNPNQVVATVKALLGESV